MNTKVILLLVGLLIGGAAGWLTAPQPTQLQVGPLSVEVQGGNGDGGSVTATDNNGQVQVQVGNSSPFNDPMTRTAIFGVIGAILGLVIGVIVDRRKV
jgi:hypothetical protein